MKTFSFAALLLSAALSLIPQPEAPMGAVKAPAPPVNPCDTNPPTMTSCWDCFNKLLTDCDAQHNTAARRAACYQGANNFYSFCLQRVMPPRNVAPGGGNPQRSSINEGMNTIMGSSFSLRTGTLEYDSIVVFVRDLDQNGEPRQRYTESFYTPFADGEAFITAFSPGEMNGDVVGIVTLFMMKGETVGVFADAVEAIDGRDMNQDGTINLDDFSTAIKMFVESRITEDQFELFIAMFDE